MTGRNPNTKANIIIPQNGKSLPDEEKRQEILDALNDITTDQIEAIWQALFEQEQKKIEHEKAEQKKAEQFNELYWDKEKILKNLKENCVKVEENVEMMWYEWEKVHINLPAVWHFEWFKFEYFVSDEYVYKIDFESNSELEEKSYSMKEVWELLKAMNGYMQAMGVETDGDMDYENNLKYWETHNNSRKAWDYLKQIAWLNERYWLSDKNVGWRKNSHARWRCNSDHCNFSRSDFAYGRANLFLRLS